ncbi:MAG TPA: methylated-DNA--[protein]-cysteine S-methyltransferase [Labilithrix sp.]|nr:methylated-DNA--[protein]-cysteine S-methyltransferase [Labilithrix sp.]
MAWLLFETPIGSCGVSWNDAGLTSVQLPEEDPTATRERLLERSGAAGPMATAKTTPGWVKDAVARVREHLAGKPQDLARVPLDVSRVTPFNAKVLRAAQAVPAGRTATYGDLAGVVGSPGASRAVGRAMATNPWPVVVPCHRVVAASGGTGGFSAYGGLVTKEKILQIEGGTLLTGAAAKQTSLFAAPKGARALPFDAELALRTLRAADPVLARHIAKVGPFRLELKDTEGTFAALAESIVYQQLSGRAAATIFGRVRALYPNGHLDPKRVLASKDEALRGAGLSGAKLASLRDLATRTLGGTIPTLAELERMDDEAIIARLTEVRGVGRWTAEMLLMFRLGRPDVLPVADYGVKKGFARVFPKGRAKYGPDELPTVEALTTRAERWRPFRSVASWYLWRALDG